MAALIPNEELDHVLDVEFSAGTQITTWYVALMDIDHTPADSDTYANSMGTANYESTDYSESARPTWQDGGVSSQSITNSSNKASFTMAGNDTSIYGAMLVSVSTKGDSGTGILGVIGKFDAAKTGIQANDVLNVTITITADQAA